MYLFFLILGGAAIAALMSTNSSNSGTDGAPEILPATGPRPTPLALGQPTTPIPATQGGALTKPDPVTGLYPSPPGPAPEGKVWSPDHGHWHDIPKPANNSIASATVNPESGLYDPPPGPAPDGKVWSPEHGHWHNAPSAPSASGTQVQRPPPSARMHPRVARQLQEAYRTYDTPLSPELAAMMNQRP